MEKLKAFAHKNPARIAAFVSSAVALVVAAVFPDMPTEAAVAFVLSALGLGEYAQRAEDKKTLEALYTDVNDVFEDDEE
jgi:magnesium-transporting ATPase (P-type)